MIIIPELNTVLILPPKTGTTAIKEAVLKKYQHSFLIYRHMEADGIPTGYDTFIKIGVVRNPLDRLWSLYCYLKTFGGDYDQGYINQMRESVTNISFSDWVLKNEIIFTNAYESEGFNPKYMVKHRLPENRKSQYVYLRPDLGTIIYKYSRLESLAKVLDVKLSVRNVSMKIPWEPVSAEALKYITRHFAWDYETANKVD